MSDLDATTTRIFLARHGETEWARNGRYTGITEIPLTAEGGRQVESTAKQLVGPGRLIDPSRVAHVWVSPWRRVQQTFRLLFGDGGAEVAGEKVTLRKISPSGIRRLRGLGGGGDYSAAESQRLGPKPASTISGGMDMKAASMA
ncbi:2,3-bisphosphoglycerate-dependent phosphoglycerate mutase [Exophiala aquamarina CBS 119918]|uniref:2,3-bisphosphoglycerate-dependent phosphoglycerate mutase n=1 Tax=Exophiala aquamarina CBS 119918 TaxID=1182545 RepID=A0A072PGT5_9EURO|nr:2,3-bisphosphoglycerate-dependent phosphoglycerate mutase [Exophiala aquamarina CBS 119918]KEF58972.1 2,3-bisphosphoglycerate-dependent phosphoglycerate mutase [Exophiala aquamarina CBS 119918]